MKLGYNKNMAILDENEFTEVDGRSYINPQVALDESNAFIDNLRSTQQSDNQKIQMDTYNLGTDISSNLGGLTSPVTNDNGGAGLSYFTSRYQTPQTESAVANLRSAAQAQALNQVLANEQEMWKKRYNDAYRKYQKSAYDKANNPSSSTGPTGDPSKDGKVTTKINDDEGGTSEKVETTEISGNIGDAIAGKDEYSISYVIDGKRYYANVYNQTGFSQERYTGLDTSTGMSYEGQHALDYLNGVVNSGGKIYNSDNQEITPYQALTGGTTSGRW